ncbi:2-oxoacid:acceptor oxidoreductase family protein [Thermoanaerobacterium sp. RBIITD]|uniref:2-oxoacid:acceptor oxidoreductase family protein n=1 Tax=Thermoanaerobacterium sp. RBIITD TaxID=1550240 RepID=UPI000BB6B6CF|nr:2-oxoacid:acceptor oxidoreductase family protein [Thermoanaerobacterium sp. RBIITD]
MILTYRIPVNDIANQLGNLKTANIVVIGAIMMTKNIVTEEVIMNALRKILKENLIPINMLAYNKGKDFINSELIIE